MGMESESRVPGRFGLAAAVAITAVLGLLVGCSDSSDSGSSSGQTGGQGQIVTGSARCDQASMQKAVGSWSKAYGDGGKAALPDTVGSYRCADGWAVAFPNVGPAETAVTVTAVFEAEGQFWIPKDRATVCGKSAADSQVPVSLYRDACQTN